MDRADFGRAADDYARHRAGFPDSFFEQAFMRGWVRAGARLLDLGTGTGTLARGFAARGCAVSALDPARAMLDQAERLARDAGLAITFIEARAEETGRAESSYDVVIAGQCWHWFDRPRAAAEARRVLAPGGRLIVAHFDWLPRTGNVVAATEALIEAHNRKWDMGGGDGRYPRWRGDLAAAGFDDVDMLDDELDVPYSHEAWRGRIRASAGVGGSLDADAVARFDAAHAAMLEEQFPADPLSVPHRVWAITARAASRAR